MELKTAMLLNRYLLLLFIVLSNVGYSTNCSLSLSEIGIIEYANPFLVSNGRSSLDTNEKKIHVFRSQIKFNAHVPTDSSYGTITRIIINCKKVSKIELMFDSLSLDTGDILEVFGLKDNKHDIFSWHENNQSHINFSSNFHSDSILVILHSHTTSNSKVFLGHVIVSKYLDYIGCGGSSDAISPCFIDVNCPLGVNYQDIKRSVVHIRYAMPSGSDVLCGGVGSGTLVNNSNRDYQPYVYSATHVFGDLNDFKQINHAYYRFYFNYEVASGQCDDNLPTSLDLTSYLDRRENYVLGAELVAHQGDNILIKLTEHPKLSTNVYFAGFSNQQYSGDYVNVSHPLGSRKKIAFGSINNSVRANSTFVPILPGSPFTVPLGLLHEGSSGSGFFDVSNKRLISTLKSSVASHSMGICSGYKTVDTNPLYFFWDNALNSIGQPISLDAILTPSNSTITYMDGEDYCPNNEVTVSNSNFTSVLSGTNNNAKSFTINDFTFVNGNFLLDIQAVEQIRITSSNDKTSRLKPVAGKIRMSVHPCTRGNPSSGRMEASENGSGNYRFFVNAYPNPSDGNVTLSFSETGNYTIVIFDIKGQKVFETNVGDINQYNLQSQALESGLYFVQASNGTELESRKIVIQ
ncbi:MAG: T9SS type A sorting domain-containing protein [Bacteroidota bacterium]|nr:T9SS type A sorting domain-containing protein [Bacteroidota bacterium]